MESIEIQLNGARTPLNLTRPTLQQLLEAHNLAPEGIAIAVNDRVVRRSEWPDYLLKPQDRVEIVQARQGG